MSTAMIETQQTVELHPAIGRITNQLETEIRMIKDVNSVCVMLEQVVAEFDCAERVSASTAVGPSCTLNCLVDHVREVVPILRWLGARGYRQRQRYEFPQHGHDGMLCYIMERPPHDARPHEIHVDVCIRGDACRFVKVGQKTEDVYELQCGE